MDDGGLQDETGTTGVNDDDDDEEDQFSPPEPPPQGSFHQAKDTWAEVHPRSKYYRNPPNFTQLGSIYPALGSLYVCPVHCLLLTDE